mgnify:CR=1 FL=1
MSGIGFDFISQNGLTLMTKYTRDQSNDSKNDSFVIALDYKNSQRSSYAMSIKDTSAKFSHDKELNNFKVSCLFTANSLKIINFSSSISISIGISKIFNFFGIDGNIFLSWRCRPLSDLGRCITSPCNTPPRSMARCFRD